VLSDGHEIAIQQCYDFLSDVVYLRRRRLHHQQGRDFMEAEHISSP